jgi:glycine/D-amino acid oxidase-like deaminating enzyme
MTRDPKGERAVVVVGAGVFGVSAALEFRARGFAVTLADPGPLDPPHVLAESTDISKIVRLDYGSDETYTEMMERALLGWRRWNAAAQESGREPLFHETGVMFLTRRPMTPGGFEHDSFELLSRRGHRLERLDAAAIRARFPAWNADRFVDGYFHPAGGWAESGRVVGRLVEEARAAGVRLVPSFRAARILEAGSRAAGVADDAGARIEADLVVVTAGTWTPRLCPWLAPHLRSVGQPVFHLVPPPPSRSRSRSRSRSEEAEARFGASSFPVFGADIARTGYYGFPLHPERGVVKIANHGIGREMDPDGAAGERVVTAAEEAALRAFLEDSIPGLAAAPLASTRVCVYGDTWDQHFWIAPDPNREGLVVAAGGSGHGFKFAPLLGSLIADAAAGIVVPRFRWRTDACRDDGHARGEEQARHMA